MVTFDSRTVSGGAGTLKTTDSYGCGETLEELIDRAGRAGFNVTAGQIEGWRGANLLPSPDVRSLGRHGTKATYPAGTSGQLIALCQIHEKHRLLKDVGWYLWLNGFPLKEPAWRPTLDRAVDWWEKITPLMEKFFFPRDDNSVSGKALDLLERNKDQRSKDQIFTQIRRRIGSENIPSLIVIALELLSGRLEDSSFKNLESGETDKSPKGDRKILAYAMGFKRAWVDRLPGRRPLLTESIVPSLIDLSRTLIQNRQKSIKNACASEIEATRDELRAVLTILSQTGYLFEQAYGKHAFGLGMVQYLAKEKRAKQQAILISLWYKIRQSPGYKEGCANIIALKDPLNSVYHKFRELQDKSREIPALRELFTPERLKKSLQSPEEGKAFSLELGRILQSLPNTEIASE
jgi:hypothetical protein